MKLLITKTYTLKNGLEHRVNELLCGKTIFFKEKYVARTIATKIELLDDNVVWRCGETAETYNNFLGALMDFSERCMYDENWGIEQER
jgi:hypothetical protein